MFDCVIHSGLVDDAVYNSYSFKAFPNGYSVPNCKEIQAPQSNAPHIDLCMSEAELDFTAEDMEAAIKKPPLHKKGG